MAVRKLSFLLFTTIVFLTLSSTTVLATITSEPDSGTVAQNQLIEIDLITDNPPSTAITVVLRLEVSGGQIVGYTPDPDFFSDPECTQGEENVSYTDTQLCVNATAGGVILDNTTVGTLTIEVSAGQSLVINKLSTNGYLLDDQTFSPDEGTLATFVIQGVAAPTTAATTVPGLPDTAIEDSPYWRYMGVGLALLAVGFTVITIQYVRLMNQEAYAAKQYRIRVSQNEEFKKKLEQVIP